jgi:hypothetical protein
MGKILKSFEAGGRNWQVINQLNREGEAARQGLVAARYQLEGRRGQATEENLGLFPFCLYQLPSNFRSVVDPTTDWRRWRVRGGRVLESEATGTDGSTDPYAEEYPALATDILVPANTQKFWFWLEIGTSGTTTAVVRYGPTPTASSYNDGVNPSWTSTNAWTSATKPDETHIPIGWVDTQTLAANSISKPRQLLTSDVVTVGSGSSAGGGGFLGIYDATQSYKAGSIVIILGGTTAGVWGVTPGKTAAIGQAPQWPMPVNATWMRLALGIESYTNCSGTTIYVNSSATS